MVVNLNVGFAGLRNESASDKESKTYALFIGDTVLVNEVSSTVLAGKINPDIQFVTTRVSACSSVCCSD